MSGPTIPDESVFESFSIYDRVYKTVSSHQINASILIPKSKPEVKHEHKVPVIINFHGGFLVMGYSTFPGFTPPWILELALENNAIIVSADYRLLPSANDIADTLEDLEDFWKWTRTELKSVIAEINESIELDMSKLLLAGGSAGGYCAMQMALSHPDHISVLAMTFPQLDMGDRLFVEGPVDGESTIFGAPSDSFLSKEDTLRWIDENASTVTTKAGWERAGPATSIAQYGLYNKHVFDRKGLGKAEFYPFQRIEDGAKLPDKIWIMHGDQDSIVYIRGTYKFLELMKQKLPDVDVKLLVAKGQEHGFDHENWTTWKDLVEPDALNFVKQAWLR